MTEPIIFEIPIYRCKLAAHTEEVSAYEQKINEEIPKDKFPDSNASMLYHFHSNIWYPWKYNEIVGYLNLYIMGTQFRADVWFVNKQRINKGIIKKRFVYRGKAFETMIPRQSTSADIFQLMLNRIVRLNNIDFMKFHFDLKTFKVIGQFVDWKELTKRLNSYTFPEHRHKYFEEE